MLEEVLRYLNNRFDIDCKGVPYGSKSGTFTIVNGTLDVDGLLDGQYFWVEGSRLNDGLHLNPATDMTDETFDGRVVFLVVPRSVEDLASEIKQWNEDNAAAVNSPYHSESFGGYSYTREGSSSGAETPLAAWQAHFGARLRPHRKLSRDWV